MRFYLDEDLSPRVAVIGRSLGLDVVSAIEVGHRGLDDEQQLLVAARDGRCLVTENRADFVRLTTVFFEEQRPHAGVLLLPNSLPTDHFTGIAHALALYVQAHAGIPLAYLVDYL